MIKVISKLFFTTLIFIVFSSPTFSKETDNTGDGPGGRPDRNIQGDALLHKGSIEMQSPHRDKSDGIGDGPGGRRGGSFKDNAFKDGNVGDGLGGRPDGGDGSGGRPDGGDRAGGR